MNDNEKVAVSPSRPLIGSTAANILQIQLANDPIVIIKPDGDIWINPKYTTTEGAKAFWDMVIQMNPLIGKR